MRIVRALVGLSVSLVGFSAQALDFTEGFNNVGTLAASGWQQVNSGTTPANSSWFQGSGGPDGVFDAQSGPVTSYAAANFLSSTTGTIANWLITPVLNISNSSMLSFFARSAGTVGFADQLDVLFSTSTTGLGGFTLLGSIGGGAFPTSWSSFTFDLPDVASGRIAFRQGGTADSADYLGIDTVSVSAINAVSPIPEPSTYAMMVLGLGGIAFMRRRRQSSR